VLGIYSGVSLPKNYKIRLRFHKAISIEHQSNVNVQFFEATLYTYTNENRIKLTISFTPFEKKTGQTYIVQFSEAPYVRVLPGRGGINLADVGDIISYTFLLK